MDYGKDTPNYTPIKTWYMLLALATIVKTGFMLKSLGFLSISVIFYFFNLLRSILSTLYCYVLFL